MTASLRIPTGGDNTMKHVSRGLSVVSTATNQTEASSTLSAASSCSSLASVAQQRDEQPEQKQNSKSLAIPYTTVLPLLVMIDMLGVSLVVPLLHSQYFQLAGVTSAVQREWLSSIFSASQIVGGLVMGALSDSNWISKHAILTISFLGSAFAYAMIVQGGLAAVIVSRVTVGLVKQTMTVTSSMMAHATDEKDRATHVGRLGASATVAFIVGPSAGAYLFSHVGTYAPIYLSCALFLLNVLLVIFCLPNSEDERNRDDGKETAKMAVGDKSNDSSAIGRILSNFRACFNSENSCLASVISALLLFHWVLRATSYKNIATYYETRYGTEPYQRGYLQSYQAALTFVVQSSLVRPILHWSGGEVNAACGAAFLMTLVSFAELKVNFLQYLVVLCPLTATAMAILGVVLKSVVSKVAPKQSLGSVFAAIDVLQNAAQVTVPFYRTALFSVTQPDGRLAVNESGDPDPYSWLIASGIHWLVATVAFAYLLLQGNPCATIDANSSRLHVEKMKNS